MMISETQLIITMHLFPSREVETDYVLFLYDGYTLKHLADIL